MGWKNDWKDFQTFTCRPLLDAPVIGRILPPAEREFLKRPISDILKPIDRSLQRSELHIPRSDGERPLGTYSGKLG
jgi:hypothetical protein